MTESIFDTPRSHMPAFLPALPFSGVFLFPGTRLDLRVYERRYIHLIFNALADTRIIGVVHPSEQPLPLKSPKLYSVGCAGRITGFTESDNLLLVTLTGLSRFRIVRETEYPGTAYKSVEADYTPFETDFSTTRFSYDKKRLHKALDRYATAMKLDFSSADLKNVAPDRVLTTLASVLPLTCAEKQALIECETREKFYDTLVLLLEMNAASL